MMEIDSNMPPISRMPLSLKRQRDDAFLDDALLPPPVHPVPTAMVRLGRRSPSPLSPSASPAKRRQLDPAPAPPRNPLLDNYVVPSYKPYWFDDGDVVLIVSDHLFKLRSATLACSDIFGDMFALAHPQSAETLDGCPIVHLMDRPQDWMLTLQWIDDPIQFWNKYDIPYETIASTLRISTKYEITPLRRIATKQVYRLWPRNIRRMDNRAFTPHRLDAIKLAYDCDLPEILPTIFYSLCTDLQQNRLPPASQQLLSPADRQRLQMGLTQLAQFHHEIQSDLHAALAGQCTACGDHIAGYWERKLEHARTESWLMRVLDTMYGSLEDVAQGVCQDCLALHWDIVDSSIKRLEKVIPRFFGF